MDTKKNIASIQRKTLYWSIYLLLLVLLLSSNRAIASELNSSSADRPFAEFSTEQKSQLLDPTPSPITSIDISDLKAKFQAQVIDSISPINPVRSSVKFVDSPYLVLPKAVEAENVNSQITKIKINGISTTHRSRYEFNSVTDVGNNQDLSVDANVIYLHAPAVEDSVSRDRVYRIEYNNSYIQMQTVRQRRDIITTVSEPQTILGLHEQISFVGDCFNLTSTGASTATNPKQLCTYTPGIATDNTSIDPNKLLPTRIIETSKFGDVVSPESLAIMRLPGFQAGANGQKIGIDLYFPRVGIINENTTNLSAKIERREERVNVPAITNGIIQQVVVSNGEQSGISQTIKGLTFIEQDRNIALTSGLQLLVSLLPMAEPQLAPGKSGHSATINPNLILAANNVRLPDNSFTAYSAGWGYGNNRSDSKAGTPAPANYNSLWIGLSPIVRREILTDESFVTTSPQTIKVYGGGEGGNESSVNTIASINNRTFSSSEIANSYSQVYLTLFQQNANRLATTRLRETTDYYPHLSLSGNTTTTNSVFRYYTGAIITAGFMPHDSRDWIKAYGGIDFNRTESSGLSYNIGAIGYVNPDPEYYSRITANASQRISLGTNQSDNITLTAGINYAIDGSTIFDLLKFRSGNSFINTGVNLNLGNVSLGTSYFPSNNLPNSIDTLLSTNISWKINDNIAVSGYYTPINNNTVKSPYGVSTSFKLGKESNSPILSLNWSHNETNFGQSASGNPLSINDNIFGVSFRFGELTHPSHSN